MDNPCLTKTHKATVFAPQIGEEKGRKRKQGMPHAITGTNYDLFAVKKGEKQYLLKRNSARLSNAYCLIRVGFFELNSRRRLEC